MDHVIGAATRGISKSIAVVSEVAAGQRRRSSDVNAKPKVDRDHDSSDSDEDILSREQDLDDAIDDVKPNHDEQGEMKSDPRAAQEVANTFIHNFENAIPPSTSPRPIPQDVILPQRRPYHRSRGFVRAYPPILGEYSGIDQAMFMQFLADFDKAAKAWPIFRVINIAAFGLGMVPHAAFMAASTAMQVVATVGEEIQTRYETNEFLDTINAAFFKPRGLYVLIMTYRPDLPDDAVLNADMTNPQAVALSKALDRDASNSLKQKLSRFRSVSSGTTRHDDMMPDPAPLIYPALDQALLTEGENNTTNTLTTAKSNSSSHSSSALQPTKSQSKAAIIQDYLDRRSQAQFLAKNPNSKLASTLPPQDKKFVNRFADPDHPVNSGSVFGLVTGGTWDPIASGRVRRAERKAKRSGEEPLTEKERHDAYMGRKVRDRVTGTPSKSMFGLKKMLGPSMLYLVVTNLPEHVA